MKMPRLLPLLVLSTLLTLASCVESPTGRKQLLLFPDAEVAQMGVTAFAQQKQQAPASRDTRADAYVQCVTGRLLRAMGEDPANWEVVLFDSKEVNAFALPGRKIGVYTGLLPVANNPHMLAAVVGHEIGHVIARHSNERLSTQFATQQGMAILQSLGGEMTDNKRALYGALGLGAQYGIVLPYGRKQESEADSIGLDLMAQAGFDPRQSVTLWQNMAKAGAGDGPEFLSTHPSNATRIHDIETRLPHALAIAQKAAGVAPACQ